MSKSILIIHTPNYCGECACHVFGHGNYRYCCLSGHRLDDKDYFIKRLDNCPLKPMPEKDFIDEAESYQTEEEYKAFVDGYETCKREVLGGEE